MAVAPREQTISVGGINVHTLIGGSGPPLLALHGAGGPNGWRRWHAALAEQFTVYAPAHPGYGLSDSADWMASVEDLARFYLWFLDVAGLERVPVVGLSLGGWLAAEIAATNPRAFDRVVLVGAAGLKPEHGEITDIFYHPPEKLREMSYHDPAQVPEWDELFGQPPTPEQQDLAMRAREMSARLIWKPYAHNPRLPYFLPRVTNQTLVVWGREDGIVPPICGEQYARHLPNATLRLIERCGHSPQIERPDAFVSLVRPFLLPGAASTPEGRP
ncbi:MAG: alpha/beta fold hydrolase [Chloroflexi bacterium]|nr:alpha/beta fold hydrolase [Chloroflexota bacterium]